MPRGKFNATARCARCASPQSRRTPILASSQRALCVDDVSTTKLGCVGGKRVADRNAMRCSAIEMKHRPSPLRTDSLHRHLAWHTALRVHGSASSGAVARNARSCILHPACSIPHLAPFIIHPPSSLSTTEPISRVRAVPTPRLPTRSPRAAIQSACPATTLVGNLVRREPFRGLCVRLQAHIGTGPGEGGVSLVRGGRGGDV